MNISYNCRCSFKNEKHINYCKTKVFAFLFLSNNNKKWSQRQGGKNDKAGKEGQAGCGMLSHKGPYFTVGGQGEFYPIILQVLEAFAFQPLECLWQESLLFPLLFLQSNSAKDAISLVYNSWSLHLEIQAADTIN